MFSNKENSSAAESSPTHPFRKSPFHLFANSLPAELRMGWITASDKLLSLRVAPRSRINISKLKHRFFFSSTAWLSQFSQYVRECRTKECEGKSPTHTSVPSACCDVAERDEKETEMLHSEGNKTFFN